MAELRTQEQQLLSALETQGGKATVDQLIQACGIQDSAVMRTALTLQEKGYLAIHAKIQNIIKLDQTIELDFDRIQQIPPAE